MEALIKVLDRDGGVKAAAKGEDQVVLCLLYTSDAADEL